MTLRHYEALPIPEKAMAAEAGSETALPPASPGRSVAAPVALPKPSAMAAPARPQPPAPQAMVRATNLLSEKTLADPRSRQARMALATFAGDKRTEQLCGIEAMAQIQAWRAEFKPDRIVPCAMSATRLAGDTLVAEGAAFRSERRWYNLKFRCELTADHGHVVAFGFRVEDAVPEEEWQSRNLPPVH